MAAGRQVRKIEEIEQKTSLYRQEEKKERNKSKLMAFAFEQIEKYAKVK